jgi:selenocysteine lyase/cysteine desulfurase
VRGGRLRTSWHVYNTEADVDRVLDVVTDEVAGSRINVGTNR